MNGFMTESDETRAPSDGEEVCAFLAGDAEAFERLVDRYQRPVLQLCQRLVGDRSEAQDAFQEAFLQVFRKLPTLREPAAFRTWLFRIVIRRCRRRWRRPEPRPAEALPDEIGDPGGQRPEDRSVRAEDRDQVQRALERLAPRQREVLVLRHLEGCSYEDIAVILGIRGDAARASHSQGLRQLRRLLSPSSFEDRPR